MESRGILGIQLIVFGWFVLCTVDAQSNGPLIYETLPSDSVSSIGSETPIYNHNHHQTKRSVPSFVDNELKVLYDNAQRLGTMEGSNTDDELHTDASQLGTGFQRLLKTLMSNVNTPTEKQAQLSRGLGSLLKRTFSSWGGKRDTFHSWGGKKRSDTNEINMLRKVLGTRQLVNRNGSPSLLIVHSPLLRVMRGREYHKRAKEQIEHGLIDPKNTDYLYDDAIDALSDVAKRNKFQPWGGK